MTGAHDNLLIDISAARVCAMECATTIAVACFPHDDSEEVAIDDYAYDFLDYLLATQDAEAGMFFTERCHALQQAVKIRAAAVDYHEDSDEGDVGHVIDEAKRLEAWLCRPLSDDVKTDVSTKTGAPKKR